MKEVKKKKNYFLMLLILIIIITLTYYNIFNENSIRYIVKSVEQINIIHIFVCLLIVFLYFLLQGTYLKILLGVLNKKIPLKKGMFYSLVEFYFSGITPSATGGQPVELYYMTKDKIPIRKSYITLLVGTIYFKLTLILLGIFALILKPQYIFNYSTIYLVFFILGFITDIGVSVIFYMLIFKQKYIRGILNWVKRLGTKIKIIKSKTDRIDVNELLKDYTEELKYIKNRKKEVFLSFIITFIQRLLLFSVAYIIYRSLGFSKYSYLDLLMIQVSVGIAIEALPLPGGTGLSEKTFRDIFITIFGISFADLGMLLTRTFSFYIPLIVSGIIVLIVAIINKKKKKMWYNNDREEDYE